MISLKNNTKIKYKKFSIKIFLKIYKQYLFNDYKDAYDRIYLFYTY